VHRLALQPDAGSSLRCSISLLIGSEEKKSGFVEAKFLFFLEGTGRQNLCKIFHLTSKKKKGEGEERAQRSGEKNNGFGKKIRSGREGAPVLHLTGAPSSRRGRDSSCRRGREGESTEKWGRKIMGLGKKSNVLF
jgi:hypothetical protein